MDDVISQVILHGFLALPAVIKKTKMYNCIFKALNRTLSNISVNFSSNDDTVTLRTRRHDIPKQSSKDEQCSRVIKSTSSEFVTSTPKNNQRNKRHYSTPQFEDIALNDTEGTLSSENNASKDGYVGNISGDVCESFNEAEVFSTTSEEDVGEVETGRDEFVFDDYYFEDNILDYLKDELDICSNHLKAYDVSSFKSEA